MRLKTFDSKNIKTGADIATLTISSPEFEPDGFIPPRYTCDGLNISPPLIIDHIPDGAESLVLIMDDPDAPVRPWVHWLAWNIPVTGHLKEDCTLKEQGINDFREHKYDGPCPPYGTHPYHFKIYALDKRLRLPARTFKTELERAVAGHVIAYGELIGWYSRK